MPQLLNFGTRTLSSELCTREGTGRIRAVGSFKPPSAGWIGKANVVECKSQQLVREKRKNKGIFVKKRPDFCLDSVTSSK